MSDEQVEITDAAEAPIEDAVEAVEVEAEGEQAEDAAPVDDENAPQDDAEETQPFPKKAVNALSRKDRKIAKLKAQLQEYEASRTEHQPKQSNEAPNEDDFDTYGEYLEAVQNYNLDKRFAEYDAKQREAFENEQKYQTQAEQQVRVAEQAQKMLEEVPDYQQVLIENGDIIEEMSPEIQQLFMEADNAPLAFYTMAKEGTLENLLNMSPMQAAIAVGRALSNPAPAPAKSKPVSSAPAPMKAQAGTGVNSKAVADMTPDEILKWVGV